MNGEILEEVYVEQPHGFVRRGHEDEVFKLKKALYGLKQAPRAWYSRIDKHFLQLGFEKSMNEHTLYKKVQNDGSMILVCIYMDDIVYMASSPLVAKEFKANMENTFEMTDPVI